MKRYFVNQEGTSNKFWNVEIDNRTQIITFGKINTQGRQSVKLFDSVEKCKLETKKLIASKIKKGYVEIEANNTPLSEEETGELFFWNSIENSNNQKGSDWCEYDTEEHLENLTKLLSKYSKQKLIQFEKFLQVNLHKLYTAEIAELYVILENEFREENNQVIFDEYISEDGFIYFRCWLLLKGKDFFDDILKDINSFVNGKYSSNIGDIRGEGLLYVADEAYSTNHKNEDDSEIRDAVSDLYPEVIHYDSMERVMNREPKRDAELQRMYPEIVDEIIYLRKNPT